MGIPLLRGREFTVADMVPDASPVALITASTARKFWSNQNPIGKHLKRVWGSEWTTVVGVVDDVNEHSLASRFLEYVDGAIYEPYGSRTSRPTEMTLVLRTTNNPTSLAGELRRVVKDLSPDVPVSEMRTLRTVVSGSAAAPRSTMLLFAVFAALAVVLGAVGIYGVISYSVVQRTPEIGIRLALGAQKRDVMRLVMVQGARAALLGIGIAGALGLTRFLSSLLYRVKPTDPLTFMAVALSLAAVALMASYIPARRATEVESIVALRYE
jgi:putative ABC transport system permease protein